MEARSGRLWEAVANERDTPPPHLYIGLHLASVHMVLALVDTGASIFLLHRDMARDVFKQRGRPFYMTRCNIPLITLNGDQTKMEGTAEFEVPGV